MKSWRNGLMLTLVIAGVAGCAVVQDGFDTGTAQDGSGSTLTDVMHASDTSRTDAGARDVSVARPDVVFTLDSGGGGGGTVPMYGACGSSADCRGTGSACLQAFPGGICTTACTTDAQCGSGHCLQMVCLPNCTSGGGECNSIGGACGQIDATNSVCLPACFNSGAPSGWPSCSGAASCDLYTGGCTATPTTMGADNGAACTADTDCKGGRCLTEVDAMTSTATGFLGGFCVSYGRMPAMSDYVMGSPIPASNCPTGSAIIPIGMAAEGDLVVCLKTCTSNSQCRSGYGCQYLQSTSGANYSSNGTCLPLDCSMSGMTCPSGTHCVTMSGTGGSYGVCSH